MGGAPINIQMSTRGSCSPFFVSSPSSLHLCLFSFLLTPSPFLSLSVLLHLVSFLLNSDNAVLCIQRRSSDAILALISTPTGLCGSICPDVQELMSTEGFGLHMSVVSPSLDVPSSALGKREHESSWVEFFF